MSGPPPFSASGRSIDGSDLQLTVHYDGDRLAVTCYSHRWEFLGPTLDTDTPPEPTLAE